MTDHKEHFHGSDLKEIEEKFHIKKEDIISFSANINPLGVPPQLKIFLAENLDILSNYPDREYTELRTAIASYCGCTPNQILVGNGSTDLISLFIQTIAPKKAVIVAPTYSEYEKEISLAGGSPLYLPLNINNSFTYDESIVFSMLPIDIDLLILCNPNNPTGTVLNQIALTKLLEHCNINNIQVLIDETYIEFVDSHEDYTAIPLITRYDNLIIIRGTSKFFACPGLRLGYAITNNEDLLQEGKKKTRPWSVSSIADAAGKYMFLDKSYISDTKKLIQKERNRVIEQLRKISGLQVFNTWANFCLIKILRKDLTAQIVFETTIKKGLMIRNCNTFPFLDDSYFRICFMYPEQNDKLIQCLTELFTS
jgi:threonine-phosphate decarboxylase